MKHSCRNVRTLLAVCGLGAVLSIAPERARAQAGGGLMGSFTRQGVGARALGLAGAFAGIADDATALYWNPAGLSSLIKPELTLNHITLYADTNNDFVSYGMPLKKYGAIGAGYLRQASAGFQKRENPLDAPTSFAIENNMWQLGWGAKLPEDYTRVLSGQVSVGFSLKRVEERIDTASGSGSGADAGLLYRRENGFSLGVVVQNILSPSLSLGSGAIPFPRVFDIAPAYTRGIGKGLKATLAARTNYYAGRFHPGGGSEFWYLDKIALRVGMESKGISTGIGIRLDNYQLDYTILMHEIAISNIISFSIRFGKTGAELAEDIRRGMKRLDQAEAERMARSYYLEGLNLAKEGNIPGAISNLEKADLLDPANKQVEGKLEGLKTEFAQKINRQLAESSGILARQQYQQGNLPVSLEYWKAVLQIDPANEEAKQAVATIRARLESLEKEMLARAGGEEREVLARAQKDRVDVQIIQFLAGARELMERGLFVEAAAEVKKALQLDGDQQQPKRLLAEIDQAVREKEEQLLKQAASADEKKDFKSAVAAYQAILQIHPDSPGINARLKASQTALYSKVRPELKKEAERLYYVAVDQYLKKQYSESSRTLSRIFELDPGNQGASKLKDKLAATLK